MCVGRGLSYIESLPSAPQEKEEDSAMDNPVAESSVILIFVCACIELQGVAFCMREAISSAVRNRVLHCKLQCLGCKKPSVAL